MWPFHPGFWDSHKVSLFQSIRAQAHPFCFLGMFAVCVHMHFIFVLVHYFIVFLSPLFNILLLFIFPICSHFLMYVPPPPFPPSFSTLHLCLIVSMIHYTVCIFDPLTQHTHILRKPLYWPTHRQLRFHWSLTKLSLIMSGTIRPSLIIFTN